MNGGPARRMSPGRQRGFSRATLWPMGGSGSSRLCQGLILLPAGSFVVGASPREGEGSSEPLIIHSICGI
ncbi:hypothetical protein MHYP_G00125290 [Metynnis hypsauchen]